MLLRKPHEVMRHNKIAIVYQKKKILICGEIIKVQTQIYLRKTKKEMKFEYKQYCIG